MRLILCSSYPCTGCIDPRIRKRRITVGIMRAFYARCQLPSVIQPVTQYQSEIKIRIDTRPYGSVIRIQIRIVFFPPGRVGNPHKQLP